MSRSPIPRHVASSEDTRAGVGFALVVSALILGTVLVVVMSDQSPLGDLPSGSSASAEPGASGVSTTLARDTVPPADVRVLVLNASGVSQAAATLANELRGLGYPIAGTGNADEQAQTTIACRAAFEDATAQLAETVGGANAVRFPTTPLEGADNADCIITLGT